MKPSLLSGAIILALTGLLSYHTVYMRVRKELRAIQTQEAQGQETQALRIKLADTLEQVERLRKRLPQTPETERLIHEVSTLANKAGIQLTGIDPQDPKPLQELTHLSVTLQFVSSYHQLGAFLSTLESSPFFLKVEDLQISGRGEETREVRLTIGTVYVPSTLPAVTSTVQPGGRQQGGTR